MKKILFSIIFLSLILAACNSSKEKETIVQIETEYGKIKIKLYNETPLHRDNFIKKINDSATVEYTFHRVVKNFMIQGGKMKSDSIPETIPAEIENVYPKYYNKIGTLGAPRWGDDKNPEKRSDANQFYIVTGYRFSDFGLEKLEAEGHTYNDEQRKTYERIGGAPSLDGDYTVFGEVTEGLDVVEKIQNVDIKGTDSPLKQIRMRVSIIEE